ncbi:class I SAM-dependent methyltransferase [Gordonia rubripertincta]|uniref:Class I SAM-dependent methyltransferase n=1 Tax=Gordonia rubripertincta TaxID=36822 RepID=A0ABT4MVS9_GORRU|nr:class I SAM-dependent methyltransferase [Gordonia rubripertincta]MCZ4551114.1 class I SAM-dependent methyltransferase [Gordonia rubripertincta]
MGFGRLEEIVADAREQGWFVEGSANAEQLAFLRAAAAGSEVRQIAEIGFNAGFSSHAFLDANPRALVTSFDLAEHQYVSAAKKHIDDEFPGRHTLIAGDSLETVPRFGDSEPDHRFDLIFIDGGHTYDIARADITNMRRLAHEKTVLVFDDLLPHKPWGEGPIRAWQWAIDSGTVVQTGLYQDGIEVDAVRPDAARGWAVGRYV